MKNLIFLLITLILHTVRTHQYLSTNDILINNIQFILQNAQISIQNSVKNSTDPLINIISSAFASAKINISLLVTNNYSCSTINTNETLKAATNTTTVPSKGKYSNSRKIK